MDQINIAQRGHDHVFLSAEHEANERRAWAVIGLCGLMMVVEPGRVVIEGLLKYVRLRILVNSARTLRLTRSLIRN